MTSIFRNESMNIVNIGILSIQSIVHWLMNKRNVLLLCPDIMYSWAIGGHSIQISRFVENVTMRKIGYRSLYAQSDEKKRKKKKKKEKQCTENEIEFHLKFTIKIKRPLAVWCFSL